MLILIEGIDRTGKSTLAKRIHAFTGGVVMHFSKPECHPVYEYTASLSNFRPPRETVILDRGHIGELVWPTVFKRPSAMDVPVARWVDMFYRSRGAVLIHADREVDDECLADYARNDEPLQERRDILLAQNLFDVAVSLHTGLPVYGYEHGEWPGVALHDAARRAVVAGELISATDRWVGTAAPRILIVGEWDEGRWFPFMPYEDADGHFLLGELDDWRQCALVSATRPDREGHEPIRALWNTLGRPTIVSFGGEAADILAEMGIEHHAYGPVKDFKRRTSPGSLRETVRRHL